MFTFNVTEKNYMGIQLVSPRKIHFSSVPPPLKIEFYMGQEFTLGSLKLLTVLMHYQFCPTERVSKLNPN